MATKTVAKRPKTARRPVPPSIRRRLEDRRDVAAARAVIERRAEEGTVPWEQIKAERGL
jgi:hypothetical protein